MDFVQLGYLFLSVGFSYLIAFFLFKVQKRISGKQSKQHIISILGWIVFGSLLVFEERFETSTFFKLSVVCFVNFLSVVAILTSWKAGKIYFKGTYIPPKKEDLSPKGYALFVKLEKIEAKEYFFVLGINDFVLWSLIYLQTLVTIIRA